MVDVVRVAALSNCDAEIRSAAFFVPAAPGGELTMLEEAERTTASRASRNASRRMMGQFAKRDRRRDLEWGRIGNVVWTVV